MWTLEILEITNQLEKLEYVVPLQRDTKNTPFCMYSAKLFLKYGLQDNNCVRNSIMKPVYAEEFQKIK